MKSSASVYPDPFNMSAWSMGGWALGRYGGQLGGWFVSFFFFFFFFFCLFVCLFVCFFVGLGLVVLQHVENGIFGGVGRLEYF